MTSLKIKLLTSALVAGFATTGAMAQTALPAAELHGAGASSIANVVPQAFNCLGQPATDYGRADDTLDPNAVNDIAPATGLNRVGRSTGALVAISAFNFSGTIARNCATVEIQPSFDARYISTGSGQGKTWWSTGNRSSSTTNGFPGGNVNGIVNSTIGLNGAAALGAPNGKTWTSLQFAFSDAPVTSGASSELSAYNAAVTTTNSNIEGAGAPVQIPFLVLPVAVAYSPVYGVAKDANGNNVPLTFNVKVPASAMQNGTTITVGGLRLNKAAYCGIFNGTITDFNDPRLRQLNGGTGTYPNITGGYFNSSSDPRGATAPIPIRLVGRSDTSGTTDITTRSLFAQCRTPNYTGTSYFAQAAESLPYRTTADVTANGGTAGPDMSGFDAGTQLRPSSTALHASATTRISGAFFNKTTGVIQGAPEAAGLFMVANGSDGVAAAVNFQPLPVNNGDVVLNGKVAYIGADWVLPSTITGTTLHSAALSDPGAPTKFLLPTAKNASAAFGTVLPPESNSTGAFSTPDTRSVNDGANGLHVAARANPLDWLGVTHVPGNGSDGLPTSDAPGSVGDPTKGYPLTGTTQLLTYTCFKDSANRFAMVEVMGAFIGKVTRDSSNVAFSADLFKGTGTIPGIFAANGVAPMPTAWITAISETYLKRSTQASNGTTLGNLNLWIQSKIPTSAADVTGAKAVTSNPGCASGKGA